MSHFSAAWTAKQIEQSSPATPLAASPLSQFPPAMSLDTEHPSSSDMAASGRQLTSPRDALSESAPDFGDASAAGATTSPKHGNTVQHNRLRSTDAAVEPPVWKRALYLSQPFEDNYVDKDSFLLEMRKNANFKRHNYFDIVKDTFAICQQMSIVVIFSCLFAAILSRKIALASLLAIDVGLMVVALIFYAGVKAASESRGSGKSPFQTGETSPNPPAPGLGTFPSKPGAGSVRRPHSVTSGDSHPHHLAGRTGAASVGGAAAGSLEDPTKKTGIPPTTFLDTIFNYCRQIFVFASAVLLLAPTFRTLTMSYTDDTIWALSITSLFIHFVFTDYTYLNAYSDESNHQTAVISALFTTILMASRIHSALHSSLLIGFGTCVFALSPIIRHHLRKASFTGHVALTSLLSGLAFGCLLPVPLLALLFGVVTCGIAFCIPWAFVKLQDRFKFQINGPWDEAKPTTLAAKEWENAGLLS